MEAFIGLLQAHGVKHLVDVRSFPRSRRNPRFNLDALPGSLKQVGIEYPHMPGLGGFRRPGPDSKVEHSVSPTRRIPHKLPEWARVEGTKVDYPAVSA